ncbi:MAG: hypothetical protein Q4A41_01555 [Bacillota bacterium]|nr:hypothetical protein [Bacillota bacterium]
MEFKKTSENPCRDVVCRCRICHGESDKLRIFKNSLVCESCVDYIRNDMVSKEL